MTIKTWQQRFAEYPMATSDVAKLGEIDDLRREVAELKKNLAELHDIEDDIDTATQHNVALMVEINNLRSKLAGTEKDYERFRTEYNEKMHERQMIIFDYEMSDYKGEAEELKAKLTEWQNLAVDGGGLVQQYALEIKELKAKLAAYEGQHKYIVADENTLVLEEGRFHKWEDEHGIDWELFPADVECDTCIDVLLVGKDKFEELKTQLDQALEQNTWLDKKLAETEKQIEVTLHASFEFHDGEVAEITAYGTARDMKRLEARLNRGVYADKKLEAYEAISGVKTCQHEEK